MLNVENINILFLILITFCLSGIYTFILYLLKFHPEKKISKFIFIFFTFFKTVFLVIIIVLVAYFFYNIYNAIDQYLNLLELKKYVKNLSRERILAKIIITEIPNNNYFKCNVELYSLTGKIFKKSSFEIPGTEFYIDFVVINFDYTFIEKGSNNIAYPNVIFSDRISFDDGFALLTDEELKKFLAAEADKFLGLNSKKVESLSQFIFKSIKDENYAKKNGVRCIVGSALHHKVFLNSVYKVYLQNTGGLTLIEETF